MARRRNNSNIFSGVRNGVEGFFSNIPNRIKNLQLKSRAKKVTSYSAKNIEQRPFTIFFGLLGIILLLIIIGSIIRTPKKEISTPTPVKNVQTYKIGTAPKISVQAKVEKSGVIKVAALTSGVVSQINVTEGQTVDKGTVLVGISNNYSGGNTASLQRQLAAAQYNSAKDTYGEQKDAIGRQRDLANANKDNADKMRDITNQGISDTQSLIDLNNDIISTLQSTLQNLENNNTGGVNDAQILATKQQISQFQSAVTQLNAAQRQAKYAVDTNNPPSNIASATHDLALQQLDIQQKALDLSLETSRINLSIATVAEASMFPAAPFSGIIERIYIHIGDNVNPGTPLLLIHGDQTLKVVAKVPSDTAQKVSKIEETRIHLPKGEIVDALPDYISTEATDGSLYSVIYTLDSALQNNVSNNAFLTVDIPVGHADTTAIAPYIPLDSVYQSQNASYIFVNKNGHAKSKQITLGDVSGQYVQVVSGLSSGDEVILSRNVIEGDPVRSD